MLRRAADGFLASHGDLLAPYRRRWVSDPLHQWSRQWEYPYVWDRIRAAMSASGRPAQVLDAGSGVTFFPYLVARQLRSQVTCVDSDARLAPIHAGIQARTGASVRFQAAQLHHLPYSDGAFDIAYCVSVLEHTRDRPAVVAELGRVLRPGGTLVVTFDLSLDGEGDIPLCRLEELLAALAERFPGGDRLDSAALSHAARAPDALTTLAIAQRDRSLMPWRGPWVCVLRALLRLRLPRRLGYTNLSCACLAVNKP